MAIPLRILFVQVTFANSSCRRSGGGKKACVLDARFPSGF